MNQLLIREMTSKNMNFLAIGLHEPPLYFNNKRSAGAWCACNTQLILSIRLKKYATIKNIRSFSQLREI